jgi:hypothetical protein
MSGKAVWDHNIQKGCRMVKSIKKALRDDSQGLRIPRRMNAAKRNKPSLEETELGLWLCCQAFFLSPLGSYGVIPGSCRVCWLKYSRSRLTAVNCGNGHFQVRLPRILAAMMVGAGLSGAAQAYRERFKNPWFRRISWGSAAPGLARIRDLLFFRVIAFKCLLCFRIDCRRLDYM